MSALQVLVVDDSAVVRQVMTALLGAEMSVMTAADPIIAMSKMQTRRPDVIVLDLEMPRMDGLTFLRKLMEETPLPVVVCSSLAEASSELTMRALQLGAVDVVLKPKVWIGEQMSDSAIALVDAIRAAAQARVRRARFRAPSVRVVPDVAPVATPPGQTRVIAIGASTGGTELLKDLLDAMPADAPPIVIVQHMPEHFTNAFARRLNETSAMSVREAVAGEVLRPGLVLVAPGDRHMTVARQARGILAVDLHDGPLVNRHRPSVDVLFESVARTAGGSAVGVIVTGMGRDGAKGLLAMRATGAMTMAQDEDTCVVFGMPREAIRRGAAKLVTPLDRIAATVMGWAAGAETLPHH